MIIFNRNDAMSIIQKAEQNFTFPIMLNFVTKIQLYFSGNVLKGIEIFGIGPQELRAVGFMVHDLINSAVTNQYRVFVFKEGTYFGHGNWHLKFIKKN